MAVSRQNLDLQSDKVITEPTFQTRVRLKDSAAVQTLFLDFDEPAADRSVNFEDPAADDTVVYKNLAQVLENKQTTTVPAAGDDLTNKDYVDGAVAAGIVDATAGSGGAVKGKATYDSEALVEAISECGE